MWPQSSQVVCSVGTRRIALDAHVVARVVRAVEVLPMPGVRPTILGFIDVGGELTPVFSPRRLLGMNQPDIDPSNVFVLVRASDRRLALVMDAVLDLATLVTSAENPLPQAADLPQFIRGVSSGPDGLILIHDVDAFLTPEEYVELDAALAACRDSEGAHRAL